MPQRITAPLIPTCPSLPPVLGAVKEWPGNDVTWRTTRATAILDRPLRAAATRDAWVGTKGWAPIVRGFTLTPFDAVRLMTGEMFPPSDPFNLAVRVYQPENSLLDGSYKIPPVTRVRSA